MTDRTQWNPAAMSAAARGDIANAIVASTPGGIERQEAQGQADLVHSTKLPKDGDWDALAGLGIVKGEPVDDLFVEAALPLGWEKRATDHSMWSELVDDNGKTRASIFYKAAFYDRSAFIRIARNED